MLGWMNLTGPPDRKAQKNPLRKSVLAALVSDMMQYVFSSGVHCTNSTADELQPLLNLSPRI